MVAAILMVICGAIGLIEVSVGFIKEDKENFRSCCCHMWIINKRYIDLGRI